MQEYLALHQINAIPVGVNNLEVEFLTNLHLYLYHRLPTEAALDKHFNARKRSLAQTVGMKIVEKSIDI